MDGLGLGDDLDIGIARKLLFGEADDGVENKCRTDAGDELETPAVRNLKPRLPGVIYDGTKAVLEIWSRNFTSSWSAIGMAASPPMRCWTCYESSPHCNGFYAEAMINSMQTAWTTGGFGEGRALATVRP